MPLKQGKFTERDRQIVEMCLQHNMGVWLAEAVQNLLSDFDDLRSEAEQFERWVWRASTPQPDTEGSDSPCR